MDGTVFPVLAKPYTKERLLGAIRELLDAPGSERGRPGIPETTDI
jgi:hypothetical protein